LQVNRYILIRRLRWPVILVLIGVVALLHQTGLIDHFWHLFWPLLLISIGVMLLAERAALAADDAHPPAPYPGQPNAGTAPANQSAAAESTAIVPSESKDIEKYTEGGQS
jgi:hypothetical protein